MSVDPVSHDRISRRYCRLDRQHGSRAGARSKAHCELMQSDSPSASRPENRRYVEPEIAGALTFLSLLRVGYDWDTAVMWK